MARVNASTNSTLLRLLSDNIVEMVQFFDGRGRCVYATASARAFFGVSPEGVMPSIAEQAMRAVVDQPGSESLRNAHASVMSSGELVEFKCQVHDAQGSVRHLLVQAKRVKSLPPAGSPGLMLVLRDIREQKLADDFEQQLGDRHSGKRVLVANAFEQDRNNCMAAGMSDFVPKPVDPKILFPRTLAALDNGAELRQTDATPSVVDRTSETPPVSVPASGVEIEARVGEFEADAPERYPGIALQHALSNWGAPGSYAKYLDVFLVTYREVVAQIQSADPKNGCALAHKLKGGAGQLGLVEVSACAARAEAVLRAGDDPENELAHLAAAMRVTCASIESFLAEYLQDPPGHSASR